MCKTFTSNPQYEVVGIIFKFLKANPHGRVLHFLSINKRRRKIQIRGLSLNLLSKIAAYLFHTIGSLYRATTLDKADWVEELSYYFFFKTLQIFNFQWVSYLQF